MEHIWDLRRHQDSNTLHKHQILMHPDQAPDFRSKPLRGNIKYNLDRFILEAHKIDKASQDQEILLMNNRQEWGNRGLPRVVIKV